jgi:hypothetical protein
LAVGAIGQALAARQLLYELHAGPASAPEAAPTSRLVQRRRGRLELDPGRGHTPRLHPPELAVGEPAVTEERSWSAFEADLRMGAKAEVDLKPPLR